MNQRMSDQAYLRGKQYAQSTNLNARIAIHEKFSTNKEKWADFIFKHLNIKPGLSVFALGCGNAVQWRSNANKFPEDCSIVLSDLSIGMLSEAKRALVDRNCFKFFVADAQNMPLAEKSFDLVTANHMLYHVPDIDRALSEIKRVLRKPGKLMAATNGEFHMQELYGLLHQFEPAYQFDPIKHRRFSLENGEPWLRQYFSNVELILFDSNLWVTDATLLTEYAYSMWDITETMPISRKMALTDYFQNIIVEKGGIFIRKSTGILLANN